jgi:lysophospholipase L1-like esterase
LPDQPTANDQLLPYVNSVHALATQFKTAGVIPLHNAFNNARAQRPDLPWTTDGVHPASAGHMLIATQWLATAKLL